MCSPQLKLWLQDYIASACSVADFVRGNPRSIATLGSSMTTKKVCHMLMVQVGTPQCTAADVVAFLCELSHKYNLLVYIVMLTMS